MIRTLVIGVILALLVGGCGGGGDKKAEPGGDASLRVKHVVNGPPYYTEGSIWHVRVLDSDGSAVLDKQLEDNSVSASLGAGRYELKSEELPCDGNCSNLDPPADSCSGQLTVTTGQELAATVTVSPRRAARSQSSNRPEPRIRP
jgi:hypothetical protein